MRRNTKSAGKRAKRASPPSAVGTAVLPAHLLGRVVDLITQGRRHHAVMKSGGGGSVDGFVQALRALSHDIAGYAHQMTNAADQLAAKLGAEAVDAAPQTVCDGAVNRYHHLLLQSYPGRADLNFNPDDVNAARVVVLMDDSGDTLFNFLWRLCDGRPEGDGGAGLFSGLCLAIEDIAEVMVAVAVGMNSDASARDGG